MLEIPTELLLRQCISNDGLLIRGMGYMESPSLLPKPSLKGWSLALQFVFAHHLPLSASCVQFDARASVDCLCVWDYSQS